MCDHTIPGIYLYIQSLEKVNVFACGHAVQFDNKGLG